MRAAEKPAARVMYVYFILCSYDPLPYKRCKCQDSVARSHVTLQTHITYWPIIGFVCSEPG
jgi:hypothetical protein